MDYFTQVTALAALSVVAVQQILKLNIIPVFFANKYPVATNVVLSIIASIIVQYQTALVLNTLVEWVSYVATVAVVAAVTYNMTLRNSDSVQRLSSKVEEK